MLKQLAVVNSGWRWYDRANCSSISAMRPPCPRVSELDSSLFPQPTTMRPDKQNLHVCPPKSESVSGGRGREAADEQREMYDLAFGGKRLKSIQGEKREITRV